MTSWEQKGYPIPCESAKHTLPSSINTNIETDLFYEEIDFYNSATIHAWIKELKADFSSG